MKMINKIKEYFVKPDPPHVGFVLETIKSMLCHLTQEVQFQKSSHKEFVFLMNKLTEKIDGLENQIKMNGELSQDKVNKKQPEKPKKPRKKAKDGTTKSIS
jgi:hypothetical protein